MSTPRPTPETDAESINGAHHTQFGLSDFARKLERKRNEACKHLAAANKGADINAHINHSLAAKLAEAKRELNEALAKLSTVYRWIERNHSDGFIDSQSHLENLDRVADAWHDKLEDMQRELGKTRDQLEAMREAIREVFNSFANEPASDSAWLLDDRQTAALTKLKPFIAL